jgi:hypothetical protein
MCKQLHTYSGHFKISYIHPCQTLVWSLQNCLLPDLQHVVNKKVVPLILLQDSGYLSFGKVIFNGALPSSRWLGKSDGSNEWTYWWLVGCTRASCQVYVLAGVLFRSFATHTLIAEPTVPEQIIPASVYISTGKSVVAVVEIPATRPAHSV